MDLSPLSSRTESLIPPPRSGFRAIVGEVRGCYIAGTWEGIPGRTAAQKAGLAYEESVHLHCFSIWGDDYLRSPRINFVDDSGERTCVPDGLALLPDRIIIIEVKSQHMPEAWWQLRRLYKPVVDCLDHRWNQIVEICRVYDPHVPFPEPIELIDNLLGWSSNTIKKEFGVYPWKP